MFYRLFRWTKNKKEGLKEAIAQFEKTGEQIKYLTLRPLELLSQGDIISSVPFYFYEENGTQKVFKSDALVLSTSCHIDQKDKLILVPVLPIEAFSGNIADLKSNRIIDYMYVPDGKMTDAFVDFEIMNTFSKELIKKGIETGRIKRISSLNQIGFYFFLIKLTLYFFRKEDTDTQEERASAYTDI